MMTVIGSCDTREARDGTREARAEAEFVTGSSWALGCGGLVALWGLVWLALLLGAWVAERR